MGGQIEAGRAVVRVEANRSRLASGLAAAQKQLQSFAAGAAKIGAAGLAGSAAVLAPLTAAVKHFADTGSQLDDMSQRTGASVEALSGLGYAAKMGGADLEDLEKGLRTMQKGLAAGDEGFGELGISIAKLKGFAPEDQMRMIANELAKIENPGDRAAAAMGIFGKSGAALLPMLQQGAKGIDMLVAEADSLGVVMSGKDAAAAGVLGDSIDRMTIAASSLVNQIGAQLAPAFTALLAVTTYMITTARDWISTNQGVVLSIAAVAAVIGVLGAGLVTVAGVAYGLSVAIGVVGTVAASVSTVLGVLTASATTVVAGFAAISQVSAAVSMMFGVGATVTATYAAAQAGLATVMATVRAVIDGQRIAMLAWSATTAVVSSGTTAWATVTGIAASVMAGLRAITLGNIVSTVASAVSMTTAAIATATLTAASGLAAGAKLAMAGASGVASAAMGVLSASAAALQAVLTFGVTVAIVAAIAALVGFGAYLLYASGVGGQAMDWLSSKFTMLSEIAGPVFKGIQDAMSGGDFTLAATILWEGIQLAWIKGTADIANTFRTSLNSMLGVLDGWMANFRSRWNDVSGWIADRMLELQGQFDSSFDVEGAKKFRAEDTQRQNQGFAGGVKDRAAGRDVAALAAEQATKDRILALEGKLAESLAKAVVVADSAEAKKLEAAKYIAPEQSDYKSDINEAYKSKSPENLGTSSGFAAMLQSMSGGAALSLDQQMYTEAKVQSKLLGKIVDQMAKGTKLQAEFT